MFSKSWLKAAAIRAIRTVAQTAIATIGTSVVLEQVNWLAVLSASVLAGILSMLMSLSGLPEVDTGAITVKAYADYDDEGNPITNETDTNN